MITLKSQAKSIKEGFCRMKVQQTQEFESREGEREREIGKA